MNNPNPMIEHREPQTGNRLHDNSIRKQPSNTSYFALLKHKSRMLKSTILYLQELKIQHQRMLLMESR